MLVKETPVRLHGHGADGGLFFWIDSLWIAFIRWIGFRSWLNLQENFQIKKLKLNEDFEAPRFNDIKKQSNKYSKYITYLVTSTSPWRPLDVRLETDVDLIKRAMASHPRNSWIGALVVLLTASTQIKCPKNRHSFFWIKLFVNKFQSQDQKYP